MKRKVCSSASVLYYCDIIFYQQNQQWISSAAGNKHNLPLCKHTHAGSVGLWIIMNMLSRLKEGGGGLRLGLKAPACTLECRKEPDSSQSSTSLTNVEVTQRPGSWIKSSLKQDKDSTRHRLKEKRAERRKSWQVVHFDGRTLRIQAVSRWSVWDVDPSGRGCFKAAFCWSAADV